MTTNTTSDGFSVSTCCTHNENYPSKSRCYWNVSFSTVDTIIPKPRKLHCPSNVICYPYFDSAENISSNGRIMLACSHSAEECYFLSHAADNASLTTDTLVTVCETFFTWLINKTEEFDSVHIEETPVGILTNKRLLYIVTLSISLLFFIAIFVVYTILPELKNLHGLILRSYISCCFVGFIIIIIMAVEPFFICHPVIAISRHFTFIAIFFWLNVMCYDIWWTFRSLKNHTKQFSRKKTIMYSLYVWGSSIMILAVSLIIEYIPYLPQGLIKPGLQDGCWLGADDAQMAYLQCPVCLTLISNICFFAAAAMKIFRQRNDTAQQLKENDSRRHNGEINRFYFYLKLFVVMGLQWFTEIIAMIWKDLPDFMDTILMLPNALQGLVFFVIFVWNDRTKRLISARLKTEDWKAIQWIEFTASRISALVRRRQE